MRGFVRAALLAPALVSAFALPDVKFSQERGIDDEPFAAAPARGLVEFQVLRDSTSPDDSVTFQLEVLPSETACGFGNITFDGQLLPQTLYGDISAGKGRLNTASPVHRNVVASWEFQCIKTDGQPDSQSLKFVVDPVNGDAVEGTSFSVWFIQAKNPQILDIKYDISTLGDLTAVDAPQFSREGLDVPQSCLEDDIADLEYMRAQLQELQALIVKKKLAIAAHKGHFDVMDCDSLKCVAKSIGGNARNAAHKLIDKIHGGEEHDSRYGYFPKPHWQKNPFHHGPDHGKGEHRKPGNHTCGPPKHGKGSHTHPHLPDHKKPHLALPICRYPPPPHRHDEPSPPPPYEPSLEHIDDQGPILLSATEGDQSHPSLHTPAATPHYHRPHQFHRRPHGGPNKAFQIIGFGLVGFLAALLVTAFHRRFFIPATPAKQAERQSRRAERRARRAIRRAAHKQAINNFLTRLGCQRSAEEARDYEEKRAALLEDSDDTISTTMTDDITEFRNAADIVSDIIAAEEGRSRISLRPTPTPRSEGSIYELSSHVEDEDLPAYEDHDGSEMSSVVADGFRYSLGRTDYTPSQSGSASDILGPDTKQ